MATSLVRGTSARGTKEMINRCLVHLHLISLVPRRSASRTWSLQRPPRSTRRGRAWPVASTRSGKPMQQMWTAFLHDGPVHLGLWLHLLAQAAPFLVVMACSCNPRRQFPPAAVSQTRVSAAGCTTRRRSLASSGWPRGCTSRRRPSTGGAGGSSRRPDFCHSHSADALSPSLLIHLLKVEGGAARMTVSSTARWVRDLGQTLKQAKQPHNNMERCEGAVGVTVILLTSPPHPY